MVKQMRQQSAEELLNLARSHLERVQNAWYEPTDWTNLALYGFYCLEVAVVAAAKHLGRSVKPNHPAKTKAAERLSREQGLPEVTDLLWKLNSARKAAAYGDLSFPELDAEDVAIQVEQYVDAVEQLINRPTTND